MGRLWTACGRSTSSLSRTWPFSSFPASASTLTGSSSLSSASVATSGLASSRLSFSSPLPPSRPPLSLILLPIPPPLLSRNPPPLLSQNPPSLSTSRCRHPSLDPCPCLHLVPVPRHHCRVSLPPFPPWLRPPPVLMLSSLGTSTKEPSSTPLPLLFLPSSISSPLKPSWRRKKK